MSEQLFSDAEELSENGKLTEGQEAVLQTISGGTQTAAALHLMNHATLDMLMNVTLQLAVELGRTRMTVRQVLDLQKGSVVELNRMAGDNVDIFVNDHLIARGEVVVVDDKFGVRITELVSPNREDGEG
jgi:flagellar motor switch protein FliN/FliY